MLSGRYTQNRASLAVIAVAGTLLLFPLSAGADNNKKQMAIVPGMVPPPITAARVVPSRAVPGMSVAVRQALTSSSYPTNQFQRAMFLKQKGDLDGALMALLKAAQENPENVKVFYEQAVIFRARGYTKLAQSALQQALTIKPDYREARMLLASVHLEDGQLSQAAQELLNSLGIGTLIATNRSKQPPALIQTPHGKLKLPEFKLPPLLVPGVTSVQPKGSPHPRNDAFEEKVQSAAEDISGVLKGIPGLSGDTKEASEPAPPPAQAQDAFDVPVPDLEIKLAETRPADGKRRKKRRVAAWLDNFLDGQRPVTEKEERRLAGEQPSAVAEAAMPTVNPLEMVKRPAQTLVNESLPTPDGQPKAEAEGPEVIPPPAPAPLDISHLFRKAMAWMPRPIFKAFENFNRAPLPAPVPAGLPAPTPAPLPVNPIASAPAALPQLAPQANLGAGAGAPAPAPVPAGVAAMPMQPTAAAADSSGLDSVLNMLPKEIAATVANVLSPRPVEIAPQASNSAPELRQLGVRPLPGVAPAPTMAVDTRQYESLVTARVASPVVAPPPVASAPPPAPIMVAQAPIPAPLEAVAPAEVVAPSAPRLAQKLSNQGFKFVAPNLVNSGQYVFSSMPATPPPKPVAQPAPAPKPKPVAQPPDDEFAKRMRYLLANGTQSLRPGEAFMFSEETGEGVLFLPGGNSVRRKIAGAQDPEEVARARRPELLAPQGELQYNLSLLGKIIKPQSTPAPAAPPSSAASNLSAKELLLEKNDGIFGWFRSVFKF